MGSLPPNLARRLSPAQSPFTERSGIDNTRSRRVEFGAPEIGNDVTRGSGGGTKGMKGSSVGGGGGRIVTGRGGGDRGQVPSTATTTSLALPVLDDGGGGGGSSTGARGGVGGSRHEDWTGHAGESSSSPAGLFASSSRIVPVAARGQS